MFSIQINLDSAEAVKAFFDTFLLNNQKLDQIMKSLDEVLADVTDESTQIDSLSTLFANVEQQLKDALSGATLPAPVQAKVDAIFAGIETNKAKVVTAINSGTPAATANPPA